MTDSLDLNSLPGLPKIYIDYILDFDRVRHLYKWDYRSIDSVSRAGVSCRSGFADRREIKPILLEQNKRFSDDESVSENIGKLCEDGCAVVTGQQIGLLCGPLYTLYKAATAIRLAEELNRKDPDRHVPVFWMECEDHDILEVGHIRIFDSAHKILTLTAYGSPGRQPTGSYLVDERVMRLIDELKENSQPSRFMDGVLGMIENSYKPNATLSDGFARFMAALFKDKGLVIVDPRDPRIKRLASDVYVQAAREWPQMNDAISESSARLENLGYELQIEVKRERPPFFLLKDGQRVQLSQDGAGFITDRGGARLTQAELESIASESPELLSPNVSLRPLIQDHLFQTNAYVGGPGEISYFAQVAPLYEILNMDMPVIFPRAGMTLIEPVVRRVIEKLGVEVIDFSKHEKDLEETFLGREGALSGIKAIDGARSRLVELFNELCRELLDAEPGMAGPLDTYRRKTDYQLSKLEGKLRALSGKRHETLTGQLKTARTHLFPTGRLQERVIGTCYYLMKFGPDLPQRVLANLNPFEFGHHTFNL